MPGTRTLVFDLGGVVLRWQPDLLVREVLAGRNGRGPSPEAMFAALFEDFSVATDWAQFDAGRLSGDELAGRIAGRGGLTPELVRAFLAAIPGHMRPNPETVALLARVRAAGHRLVYLSNMPTPFADLLERSPDFGGWFDAGVFSCRVAAVKPQPEIFRIAQERLELEPAELLLVDDRPDNLTQAGALGWPGLLFVDAAQCAADLERLGWLP